jgi:hypothetical protein
MPGGVASARRERVTRAVVEGGSRMPRARVDIGRDAKT